MAGTRPRVIIIGAGFGGLGMAIRLKQAGIDSFVILEKSDGVGGTWRNNTYPGAACDVPSHLYSFSFHLRADWSRRYAGQAEILGYLEECVRVYGLGPHLRFGAEVASAAFDEAAGVWRVVLGDGEVIEGEVVVAACGQLNRPAIPDLPGLSDFAGTMFHSARWDHGYDVTGKRVAVVGTGASAIQFVPELARKAARVHVFQRSAPYVIGKSDRPYRDWEKRLYRAAPLLLRASRLAQYVSLESRAVAFVSAPRLMAVPQALWRRRLRREIPDPKLRARLVPDYVMGCKRILLSNDWYATLRRDNVELVTARIRAVRANRVITEDGAERDVDALIFGTGFAATDFLVPMRITGRGGRDLHASWRDGAEAYLGVAVSGFPNFFLLYGPNTNLGHNSIIYMLESQIGYVLQCIQALSTYRLRWMDVRPAVQRAWNARIRELSAATVWESGCSSWYTTASGRNTNNWPGYTFHYRRRLRRPDLSDYQTAPAREPVPSAAAGQAAEEVTA